MPSLGHNFTTCNCTTTTTATAAAAVSSKLEPTASDVSLVDIVEVVEGHNQTNLSSEGYNNSLLYNDTFPDNTYIEVDVNSFNVMVGMIDPTAFEELGVRDNWGGAPGMTDNGGFTNITASEFGLAYFNGGNSAVQPIVDGIWLAPPEIQVTKVQLCVKGSDIEIVYIYSTGQVGWVTTISNPYSSDLRFFISGHVVGGSIAREEFRGTLEGLTHIGNDYVFDSGVHTHSFWHTDTDPYFGLTDRFIKLN